MATVYKIEIEIVSEWCNYTEETLARIIKENIDYKNPLLIADLEVKNIKVERK